MASTKKKSTVQIPVTKNGSVPHYTEDRAWLTQRVAENQIELDGGFTDDLKNEMSWNKSPRWKDEAEWRASLEKYIETYTYDWRDPWEFEDTFIIDDYSRGRSAAIFNLTSQTNPNMECTIFMSDMIEVIRQKTIVKGVVSGRWIFCKKGQNYGIRLVEEKS